MFDKTFFLAGILSVVCFITNFPAQEKQPNPKLDGTAKQAREYSLEMLDEMKKILKENYYDPQFHQIDLTDKIEAAKTRVKTMQYNWQMYRVLVQVLMDFNDSHTRLILPPRTDHFEYGFNMQMIGNECFVTAVQNDSNAHSQGLTVGDQIVSIGKFQPSRSNLWKIIYVIYKLDPADTLDLKIRKPDGTEKAITVQAKKMSDKEYNAKIKAHNQKNKTVPFKCQELNKDLIACKLYSFIVDKDDIDKMMKQASKYPKLILDLRGNGGGYVEIEQYLMSYFFDREVKIADMVSRKKTEFMVAKPMSGKSYKGELAVLVDSNSASASEITARSLQIEKRAKIYGDVSAGKVMTSIAVPFTSIMSGLMDAAIIRAGMSVTVADIIMRDGSRLENSGVVPDEILQPLGSALVLQTDPVLAYVALKLGVTITPEDAGKFYFIADQPEDAETTVPNGN